MRADLIRLCQAAAIAACAGVPAAIAQEGGSGGYSGRVGEAFINWESPQVHPLDMTPDGTKLLAVNTADNRLMVFDLSAGVPVLAGSAPVGLDPVTVRARSNTEAWVVNHVSDSVSIVNLTSLNVTRTLKTQDEPCDVVFAAGVQRAFVSCSQANTVQVFSLTNLAAAPTTVAIGGEDPRSLAISPDGTRVYAAVFESGNGTTILGGGTTPGRLGFPPNVVSDPAGPYGGVNPPPNAGNTFVPPQRIGNPAPPAVGLIVRKNGANQWMDDNAHNWTALVSGAQASLSGRPAGWDLADRDIAAINTSTLSVTYATRLMNICMSLAVNPANGQITLVGTDATNEIRFEPNLRGRFIRVNLARVDAANLANKTITDLNSHLTYSSASVSPAERARSIGDPRAIVWNTAGTRAYVAGMGSNNVVVIDSAGARAGLADTIPVGEGPTGLALDDARGRLYVLNRFGASISVVGLATETELGRVSFFDPTPDAIRIGRKHLYNTHRNSGLGQIACASCHVDARMDRLAWDLGDPSGEVQPLDGLNLGFGLFGLEPGSANPQFEEFHPMKGPMTTQTLQDIVGKEPHHWRGDRFGLEAFSGAFAVLQGGDAPLDAASMQEFERFIETIHYPPNPFRNFDNTLPSNLPLPGHSRTGRFGNAGQPLPNGNAVNGLSIYRSTARRLDAGSLTCVVCHTLPTGAGADMVHNGSNQYLPIPPGPNGEHHIGVVSVDGSTNITIKIPQLRNGYEKAGFDTTQTVNTAGFGYLHDGSVDSLERFVAEPIFTVNSDQEVADLTAFMLAFSGSELPQGSPFSVLEPPGVASKDTHAAVGTQTTLVSVSSPDPGQLTLISSMITQANANKVGVVAKGRVAGLARGWAYVSGGSWQSDRAGETITTAALQNLAAPGSEITFTVVPRGTQTRIGIDRDLDGCFDRDEADGLCGQDCNTDYNQDGGGDNADVTDLANDIAMGMQSFPPNSPDFNNDGGADNSDVTDLANVIAGGPCP